MHAKRIGIQRCGPKPPSWTSKKYLKGREQKGEDTSSITICGISYMISTDTLSTTMKHFLSIKV
eukprot:1040477-Amphidinium_carterae.1